MGRTFDEMDNRFKGGMMATEPGDIINEAQDMLDEMQHNPLTNSQIWSVQEKHIKDHQIADFRIHLISAMSSCLDETDMRQCLMIAENLVRNQDEPAEPEKLWNIFAGPRGIVYLTKVSARTHAEAIAKARAKIEAAGLHAIPESPGPEGDMYGR